MTLIQALQQSIYRIMILTDLMNIYREELVCALSSGYNQVINIESMK